MIKVIGDNDYTYASGHASPDGVSTFKVHLEIEYKPGTKDAEAVGNLALALAEVFKRINNKEDE